MFNFSGVTVAKRWTRSYKRLIADSRINTTRNLVRILGGLSEPPRAVITASGLAIYGDRGEEHLTEDSPPGTGFLASVAIPWEETTAAASGPGCRALTARFGMVMSGSGGALPDPGAPIPARRGRTYRQRATVDALDSHRRRNQRPDLHGGTGRSFGARHSGGAGGSPEFRSLQVHRRSFGQAIAVVDAGHCCEALVRAIHTGTGDRQRAGDAGAAVARRFRIQVPRPEVLPNTGTWLSDPAGRSMTLG